MRPLVLEFSWDETAAAIDDQYLLGRDLLVAPIFSEQTGPVSRRVHLPRYANWYDWWTGEMFEGGQWVETTSPLERLPLYARAGTAIPLADPRPPADDGTDPPLDVTRLLLFAPRDGAIGASIELADGDMLGVEHERGAERSRIYVEGLPPTEREIAIVGLSPSAEIVDAASPRVRIVPGDDGLARPRWTLEERDGSARRGGVHDRAGTALVAPASERTGAADPAWARTDVGPFGHT